MPVIPITNENLYNLSVNPQALKELYENIRFNRFRDDFFKKNQLRIDSVYKKRNALVKSYYALDEKGMVKMNTPVVEGDEQPQRAIPVMLEGKMEEDYSKDYEAWAKEENRMEI